MASTYDGTIRIDTSVDPRGLNKGTKTVNQSMSGLIRTLRVFGAALGIAFTGAAVFRFAKNTLETFDLMASSVGGNIKAIKDAFSSLRTAFAQVFAQALIALTPFIITVINWLTKLLMILAAVVQVLFGVQQGMGAVADETKAAAKEAKGALAPFDQLNVLQEENEKIDGKAPSILPPLVIPAEMLARVEEFKKKVLDFLQPVILAFIVLWTWFRIVLARLQDLKKWIDENPEKFRTFAIIVGLVVLAFRAFLVILWLVTTAIAAWNTVTVIAAGIGGAFAVVLGLIASPIFIIIAVIALIVGWFILWIGIWILIGAIAIQTIGNIKDRWKEFAPWFNTTVIDPFKKKFDIALDAVKEKFKTTFAGVKDFLRGVVNNIIDLLNGMVRSVVNAINNIVNAFNTVGGVLPGFIPLSHVSAPSIPRLATGAVIPPNSEFAAILGDQRSGRNIETPEKLLRQIMREERAETETNIIIKFEGSLAELARILKPVIDKETTRKGSNLVKGTAKI